MTKKIIIAAIASVAGLGFSSIALANCCAPAAATPCCDTGAGFVIGIQGGYGDTHWDNVFPSQGNTFTTTLGGNTLVATSSNSVDDDGFAGRVYAGYDFNHYFGLEAGYIYLPQAKTNGSTVVTANGVVVASSSFSTTIDNYAVDLLAKLMVPVVNGFGLYAKAGGAYFHSSGDFSTPEFGGSDSTSHIGPAFGVGASYEIIPNLALDLSWMRYSGDGEVITSNGGVNSDYQPNPDVVLLGLSYKFPTSL